MGLLGDTRLELPEILVRPVRAAEERRYQELLQPHHSLGAMKGHVQLLPGWDVPIDLDRFLKGDL